MWRVLLVAGYVLLPLVAALVGLAAKNFLPFVAVAGLLDIPFVLLTFRRTKLEYEYAMTGGLLTFSYIYGGATRRLIFETALSDLRAAFPYASPTAGKRIGDYAPEVQYFALETQDAAENANKEIWCCLFENEGGKRAAFYFELTDAAYRCLRTYATAATDPRKKTTA